MKKHFYIARRIKKRAHFKNFKIEKFFIRKFWNLEKSVENFDIFEILKIENFPQQFSKFTLKITMEISKFWKIPENFGENFSDEEFFDFKIFKMCAVFFIRRAI